jgi:hypothetical protein
MEEVEASLEVLACAIWDEPEETSVPRIQCGYILPISPVTIYARALSAGACCGCPLPNSASLFNMTERFRQCRCIYRLRSAIEWIGGEDLVALVRSGRGCL